MILIKSFIKAAVVSILIGLLTVQSFSQKTDDKAEVKRVMWEAVNISERDLFYGPGGQQMSIDLKNLQYIGRQQGGTSVKYRYKDNTGREWVAKMGRETQPETAAVRILWGLGYKTEINYLVKSVSVPKLGNYKNVRFEARPQNVKRLDSWSWANNPFVGTNELEGLKLMMAMFNNWDIKDENTAIIQEGDVHHYIISDLGATFGKLPETGGAKSGRSVNKPEQYAQSKFVKQVRDGVIELDYRGRPDNVIGTFKVEHGRWLADLLMQLSDKQIEDAFRAANYDDEDIKLLAQAFKARINELDEATKPATATNTNE